jgi:hypothetical protein
MSDRSSGSKSEENLAASGQVPERMAQKDADVLKLAQEIVALVRRHESPYYAKDALGVALALCNPSYVYESGD